MSRLNLLAALVASLVAGLLPSAPAQAQSFVTYVSQTGSDANDCTAPSRACASFSLALDRTADYGTVVCNGNPVPPGVVTITKPVMISCTPGSTPIQAIVITPSASAVRLRNVHVNGRRSGGGALDNGIVISSAGNVIIEDCVIENFIGFGIAANHSGGGRVLIKDTTIQNNATGIGLFPGAGDVRIESSRIDNNFNGIGVGNTTRLTMTRSVLSGNFSSALVLDPGGVAIVDSSTISSNATGITAPNGSTVLLSNNNIFLNTTAFSGTTLSYRNNQIQFSGIGTTPTALGSAQQPFGTM